MAITLTVFLVSTLGLMIYVGHSSLGPRFWSKVLVAFLTGSLLVGGAAPVWAVGKPVKPGPNLPSAAEADSSAQPELLSPNGGAPDASDIPSETVSRFVAAYLAVVDLIDSKEASLQRAETDTESRQMQEELQRQAIDLIKEHELTLQAYWELLGLANSDPEFRERVLAQVEEASL